MSLAAVRHPIPPTSPLPIPSGYGFAYRSPQYVGRIAVIVVIRVVADDRAFVTQREEGTSSIAYIVSHWYHRAASSCPILHFPMDCQVVIRPH